MVEFDVRLTRDGQPVLQHDFSLLRTHRHPHLIELLTLDELRRRTAGSDHPVVTLEEALGVCYGKILINIELKRKKAVEPTLTALRRIANRHIDWQLVMFSSFYVFALQRLRRQAPEAQLALLHGTNPLRFLAWQHQLRLMGVGFYRLHYTSFALQVAGQLGLFRYAYTVDRPEAMLRLAEKGMDGIVTNVPGRMVKALAAREKL